MERFMRRRGSQPPVRRQIITTTRVITRMT